MLDLNALTGEFVQRMQHHYGDRLARVVLYGSYARGDFHEESDVDLLVVLNDEAVNGWEESKALFDTEETLSDQFSSAVQSVVVPENLFLTSNRAIFRFIRRDGVSLYERRPVELPVAG